MSGSHENAIESNNKCGTYMRTDGQNVEFTAEWYQIEEGRRCEEVILILGHLSISLCKTI
jgi:hypothetical protein